MDFGAPLRGRPAERLAPGIRWCERFIRRTLLPAILDLTLPTDCFVCRSPLGAHQLHGACAECWSSLHWIRPPFCPACSEPVPEGTDLLGAAGGRCPACVLRPRPFERSRAAVVYDGTARRFVLRGKMARRPELLRALGARLGLILALEEFATSCSVVISVPSHPWARFRRGFNPAAEVADGVYRALRLPRRDRWLRRRWRLSTPVKRLSARNRTIAVHDAFVASSKVRGHRVLLVDDVRTTGATLAACARALRSAGASEVHTAVWAATPLSGGRSTVGKTASRL